MRKPRQRWPSSLTWHPSPTRPHYTWNTTLFLIIIPLKSHLQEYWLSKCFESVQLFFTPWSLAFGTFTQPFYRLQWWRAFIFSLLASTRLAECGPSSTSKLCQYTSMFFLLKQHFYLIDSKKNRQKILFFIVLHIWKVPNRKLLLKINSPLLRKIEESRNELLPAHFLIIPNAVGTYIQPTCLSSKYNT